MAIYHFQTIFTIIFCGHPSDQNITVDATFYCTIVHWRIAFLVQHSQSKMQALPIAKLLVTKHIFLLWAVVVMACMNSVGFYTILDRIPIVSMTEMQTSKELMDTVGQYRKSNLTPIVIIPGAMESLLEAKLNKKTTVSYICSRTSDWCTLWITESALFASKCFFDDIKMRYLGKRKRPCDSSVLVLWFRLYLTTKTTHSVFGWPAMEKWTTTKVFKWACHSTERVSKGYVVSFHIIQNHNTVQLETG